jgi:hypothetical protein
MKLSQPWPRYWMGHWTAWAPPRLKSKSLSRQRRKKMCQTCVLYKPQKPSPAIVKRFGLMTEKVDVVCSECREVLKPSISTVEAFRAGSAIIKCEHCARPSEHFRYGAIVQRMKHYEFAGCGEGKLTKKGFIILERWTCRRCGTSRGWGCI